MFRLFNAVVILSQLISLLGISSVSDLAVQATPADLEAMRDGIASFVFLSAGLQNLDELGNPIPFSIVHLDPADDQSPWIGLRPLDVQGLAVAATTQQAFNDLRLLPVAGLGSADDLADLLSNAVDGPIGDTEVNLDVAITSGLTSFTIQYDLTLTRVGAPATLYITHPDQEVTGGSLAVDLTLNASFVFEYTPGSASGEAFVLPLASAPGTLQVTFSGALDSGPFSFNLGILQTTISGTADTNAALLANLRDPDSSSILTQREWETTSFVDLFDVGYTASSASLNLEVATDLPGLAGSPGAITLADSDLANGLDQPSLSLDGLEDFKNLSPQDFISGFAQLAILLEAVQVRAGSFPLPFVKGRMDDVADFNEGLLTFFTKYDLSNVDDPLKIEIDQTSLEPIDTVQEVLGKLDELGLAADDPADLGITDINYNPTSQQLTFGLGINENPDPVYLDLDFADQLAPAGLISLITASQAEISPSYAVSIGLSVDFAPDSPAPAPEKLLLERFKLQTSGQEFEANALIAADIDMQGRIGFLGVQLQDSDPAGPVPLLSRRAGDNRAMLQVDIDSGAAGALTFQEFFALLNAPITALADQNGVYQADMGGGKTLTIVVNAAVPPFTLNATALLGQNDSLQAGSITASWADITQGTPVISLTDTFSDQLLAFDYNHANPLDLLEKVLAALDLVTSSLDGSSFGDTLLTQKLPLVGVSYRDLVREIGAVKSIKDQVEQIANDPAYSLAELETYLNEGIAVALGVSVVPAPDFITIRLDTTAGTAAINFSIGLGVCSDKAADPTGCVFEKPLELPFNLSLGDVLPSGLVGLIDAQAQGKIAVDYQALVRVDFGVQLPEVSLGSFGQDAEGNVVFTPPSASGVPEVYLWDTTRLRLQAGLSAQAQLSAALGPLEVRVGETDPRPESGDQCNNNLDDDKDGVVNDGCPVDGPETQCDNNLDDDGDGYVNDGCPIVGDAAETVCDGAVDDDSDGKTNDGCPTQSKPETDAACDDAVDSDSDGLVNDGCPAVGNPAVIRLGAQYELSNDLESDNEPDKILLSDSDALSAYFTGLLPDSFVPAASVTCAGVVGNHHACARLPVFLETSENPLGVITFAAPDITKPDGDLAQGIQPWQVVVPPEITTALSSSELQWLLFFKGLQFVSHSLESALKASSYGVRLPVLGNALDAGANVFTQFNTNILDPFADFGVEVAGKKAGDIKTELETFLTGKLGSLVDDANVVVALRCGSDFHNCDLANEAALSISEAEFQLTLGQTAFGGKFGFDLGLPGLRLATDGDITSSVDWSINLGIGVSKRDGFYLLTNQPLAVIGATVDLPAGISGDLAFIRVSLKDQDDTRPDLSLSLSAGLTNTSGRLTFSNLASTSDPLGFDVSLTGGVHLDLELATTADIGVGGAGALPTVYANLLFDWDFGGSILNFEDDLEQAEAPDAPTLKFVDVKLDIGSFFSGFLGPILGEVQRYTKPLQPVIDTISAPIPGITQLAALVGEPPVTMLDLFKLSGANLTMIERIIDLVSFINQIGDINSASLMHVQGQIRSTLVSGVPPIDLGSFEVDLSQASKKSLPAGQKANLVKNPAVDPENSDLLGKVGEGKVDLKNKKSSGFSFPAFENPSSIFSLLVGQDVTLIRWDAGKLEASFGFSKNFGPIAVGPIPVSIVISGSAKIEGHFAVGYDTRGIRMAVEAFTEDPTSDFAQAISNISLVFNGIFLDDLDEKGNDVPEIRLTATLSAGAAVDLVIISAGIEGGVKATIDMNLHDGGLIVPPNPDDLDGKLRINEIFSFVQNPICMFDVSGRLEAFIRVFVKIDFFFFSKTFRKTIVNIVLLDLKNITAELCTPKEPVLAGLIEHVLVLNIGPRAGDREYDQNETDEKITVRQLSHVVDGLAKVSVAGFGFIKEFEGISAIFGDAGSDTGSAKKGEDKDVVVMAEGAVSTKDANGKITTEIFPFTLPTVLCGGRGADRLAGGEGNDILLGDYGSVPANSPVGARTCHVSGSAGVDSLNGNGGDDILYGGAEGDDLGGDAGNDILYGDGGQDKLTGGFGADELHGGSENDDIQGGPEPEPVPDLSDLSGWKDGVTPADVVDHIYGDEGDDNLEGDVGDDWLYGGLDKDTLLGDKGNDHLFGQSGDDRLFGNEGDDLLYGDDQIEAETDGHDYLSGDQGDDLLYGGGGNDDLLGGTDTSTTCGENAGSPGGDELRGGSGRDYLLGDEGIIYRTPGDLDGSIELQGEHPGNDRLYGGGDADLIYGQAGCDLAEGGSGEDELHGGAGDDDLFGQADRDTLYGDGGEDLLYGDEANDTLRGGEDDDEMYGNSGDDTLFGDSGDDRMFGGSREAGMSDGTDTMYGNAGNDYIAGDNGHLLVDQDGLESLDPGLGAKDFLYGDAGEDVILGGFGADQIEGNLGRDVLLGDNGKVILSSGLPSLVVTMYPAFGAVDNIHGNEDADILMGGAAGDDLFGDAGDDLILGDHGQLNTQAYDADPATRDVIEATDPLLGGNDIISGGDGADLAFGGTGTDDIHGDAGDDILFGDHARFDANLEPKENPQSIFTALTDGGDWDTIHGDDGDDRILDGQGADQLYGDLGADDLIGGHNVPGGSDSGDWMYGESDTGDGTADGSGPDLLLGDNGQVWRSAGGLRISWLYDIASLYGPAVDPGAYGADHIWGNSNNDRLYGQGGEDELYGGAGDDIVEGNGDSDLIYGGSGDDDLIGGTGRINDDPPEGTPGRLDASTRTRLLSYSDPLGNTKTLLVPLGDEMLGGDGSDVILGDNGIIERTGEIQTYRLLADSSGETSPRHFTTDVWVSRAERIVRIIDPFSGDNAGSDLIYGEAGEDDLYGLYDDTQRLDVLAPILGVDGVIGDELYGGPGEDAILGDNGVVVSIVLDGAAGFIEPSPPFIEDEIDIPASLYRQVTLEYLENGGDDRLSGGNQGDWMHGGAGNDILNGNRGDDRLFGDHGDDVVWGGYDHDHLYGGYGNDYLDIRPRLAMTFGKKIQLMSMPADRIEWFVFGTDESGGDNYEGYDYIYGGWGQDAMQADVGQNGPGPGDRLLDWVGAYNAYYKCGGAYGEFVITRSHSPSLIQFLLDLAAADGATGLSGAAEAAIVYPEQASDNSNPVHPDNPGHFTCTP